MEILYSLIQRCIILYNNQRLGIMAKRDNIAGLTYGNWEVLYPDPNKNRYWICKCKLCNTLKSVHVCSLKSGRSTSCGCTHLNNKIKGNIIGNMYGNWKVIGYAGNNLWTCECQCEDKTIKNIAKANLLNGKSKSCGCLRRKLVRETLLTRYGETNTTKMYDQREQWQIDTLESKDLLGKYILEQFNGIRPTFLQLSRKLGVSRHTISVKIHKYQMENFVTIDPLVSDAELELLQFVKYNTSCKIESNTRTIIPPYELDIYIPDKKLALEYNGTYWHSTEKIDVKYHQKKTIACAKQGIRLIHIFEYEWKDKIKKEKIKDYIYNILNDNKIKIYARKTKVKVLSNSNIKEFYDKYHFQNSINSSINLALTTNDEIIAAMSFSVPRFNSEYQYELTRLCIKTNYIIVGGTEKLFTYFIKNYSPKSIITYTDISKFTGNVYLKLGFRPIQPEPITEPNYVWVEKDKNIVLSRYQTQKHKLIEAKLGKEEQTEDEIMEFMGYFKVCDSGNIRLAWYKDTKI